MKYFNCFYSIQHVRVFPAIILFFSVSMLPTHSGAETVERTKEKIAAAIKALGDVEGDVSGLSGELAGLKSAIAKLETASASEAETVEGTKTKLTDAALALRLVKAKPAKIQAELTALKTAIGVFEARTPGTQLKLDAASILKLIQLLKYERTDKDVLAAVQSLRDGLVLYDAADPEESFTRLADALAKLNPDETFSLSVMPVREALDKALPELLALEATRPNKAVKDRAKRLSDLIMQRKADLEQHRIGSDLQILDDEATPFRHGSDEDALIAEVKALTKRLEGIAELPKDAELDTKTLVGALDTLLGPLEPRAIIVSATFGDFRTEVARSRQCDATSVLRESCDGVARCKLSNNVGGTGTVAEKLCGYDPAPTAPAGAMTLKVEYGCVSATTEEWAVLTATPGTLMPEQEAVEEEYPGLLGTIACAPNAARKDG